MAKTGNWERNKGMARAILSQRAERRRVMTWLLGVTLSVFIAGLWILDDWLSSRLLVFMAWWSGCTLLTLFLMLLALHDGLKTIQGSKKGNDE